MNRKERPLTSKTLALDREGTLTYEGKPVLAIRQKYNNRRSAIYDPRTFVYFATETIY